MESYGQTNYIFLFFSWAFVSLRELNLCINYTSELNEGAGVPVTAFEFYQETLNTHLASSESSYESFLLGSWGPWGAELGGGRGVQEGGAGGEAVGQASFTCGRVNRLPNHLITLLSFLPHLLQLRRLLRLP